MSLAKPNQQAVIAWKSQDF